MVAYPSAEAFAKDILGGVNFPNETVKSTFTQFYRESMGAFGKLAPQPSEMQLAVFVREVLKAAKAEITLEERYEAEATETAMGDVRADTMHMTFSRGTFRDAGRKAPGNDYERRMRQNIASISGWGKLLRAHIDEMRRRLLDPKVLWRRLSFDFFDTNEQLIFSSLSEADAPNFPDLNPAYADEKGKFFPGEAILVRHGNLMHSLTNEFAPAAISDTSNATYMRVGTADRVAPFALYYGRNPVQIDPPTRPGVESRLNRWMGMANDYIMEGA